jgi:restriction system protein
MPRKRNDGIIELLAEMPWWVSVVVAVIVYVGLRFIIPALPIENPILKAFIPITPKLATIFGLLLLVPAGISFFNSSRKRKLVEAQTGIDSIRALSWKEFEELLGEAFRRTGYTVHENSGKGPDGGVDLVIEKSGEQYLVQCKQWRTAKVGVKVIREMYGIMTARGSHGVIVVSSGMFTQEAELFAKDKPVELIGGFRLLQMIADVRSASLPPITVDRIPEPDVKTCPRCDDEMVVRTAKKGLNSGSKFWGCSGYPRCRYTEAFVEE